MSPPPSRGPPRDYSPGRRGPPPSPGRRGPPPSEYRRGPPPPHRDDGYRYVVIFFIRIA